MIRKDNPKHPWLYISRFLHVFLGSKTFPVVTTESPAALEIAAGDEIVRKLPDIESNCISSFLSFVVVLLGNLEFDLGEFFLFQRNHFSFYFIVIMKTPAPLQ